MFCTTKDEEEKFHFLSTVFDNHIVSAIQIYVDGTVKFETPDDFLNAILKLTDGEHRVTVKAWDDVGPFSMTKILQAQGPCINMTDRTVRICAPHEGAVITGTSGVVRIVATAETNLRFSSTQIYVDGELKFHTTVRHIDTKLLLLSGTHRVTVKGWDSRGPFSSTVMATTC